MRKNNNRIKISGNLKSNLRKKHSKIIYTNLVDSNYFELAKVKQRYIPKFLLFQLILNLILIFLTTYFKTIYFLIFVNFIVIWLYSLISILKNEINEESKKSLWIILILFIPISVYFYPDFRRTQVF